MCIPKLFSFPLALAATHPPPSDDGKGLSFAMQDVIPMVPSKARRTAAFCHDIHRPRNIPGEEANPAQ
jgi:hypothetical protein